MATVHCSKCTAERKGFRRELDLWRHKLIHCVGFESILEGIYGPLFLRDLNLFDDCEPEEVIDWSPEGNGSQCSFCNLPLDKLDQVLSATSPLSSPSDYSPRHVPTLSESSQSAHRFLQAVFHKKDVPLDCDPNIPLIAQELMTNMIRQFAVEYASKCLLHTTANGVPTRTSSPQSETSDSPLDLTVSRAPEEKESQPDGVLDLSSRKSACLPSSKSSVSSLNHKASGGCRTTIAQETGEPGQQGTKYLNSSALGAVFSCLCPVHRSLLFQILKLAREQKLLFFKNLKAVQSESYCCHNGLNFEDHIHQVKVSDCKVQNSHLCPSVCDNCSRDHPRNSKSNECRNESPRDSNCCAVPRCKRETFICPERVHCFSCQSLSLSDFKSAPPLVCTSSLCSLSICCSKHNEQSCFCHLNHSCISQDKSTTSTEKDDISCSVLKREQSPSPPPLSPIPSDLNKQSEERPPSLLHHIQKEEAKPVAENCLFNASHDKVNRRRCRNAQICESKNKPSGTLVQDVVNRFSEKLETIKPLVNVPLSTASVAEMEPLEVASRNVPLNAEAHLTEIISTVLHTGTGRAGEYNLSELINDQDNSEPISPNTRSKRRQEVLAAMTTSADDATARRHSLQIKRELGILDQACNEHKRAKLKYERKLNTSHAKVAKEKCQRDVKKRIRPVLHSKAQHPIMLNTGTDDCEMKDNVQAAMVTENIIKTEAIEAAVLEESHLSLHGNDCTVTRLDGKFYNQVNGHQSADLSENVQCPSDQKEARKSKRKIVPPTRFSSYVTEPRTKYFVACFSDGIFTQKSHKYVIAPPNPDNCASENTNEFSLKADCEPKTIFPIATEQNHIEDNSDKLTDCKSVAKRCRRSQPPKSPTNHVITSTCIESPLDPCFQYTSPIKLMFVSPVKDEEGIRYSLKSAAAVNGLQEEECFDPCEESFWSGTPEKNKSRSPELATPKSSPLKTATSPKKTAPVSPRTSPNKTSPTKPSSPAKSVSSPKSATSSPKAGSRRSGESTPTKRLGLDETQRSPRDVPLFHETTPPKRRPGRPKKLGPQLEKKVKRPIGRPRKDKSLESTVKEKLANGNPVPDVEENVNKNLKITVVYGRSRRNKRMVSEGFDQLQTEFRDACQAVGLNKNLSMLMNTAKDNGDLKTASVELSQEFPLVRPVKDCASHSKTNIKCQSLDDSVPSRKPGRPAKVKISGISVTVTTVSPRQRRIQINRENKSPVKQTHKRALLQKFISAKELKTITCHSVSNSSQQEQELEEAKVGSKEQSDPPIAVRHSERVRKPSIHFLHAVATSSSYSRSSALVRRSKQVLLNKANNERKKEESESIAQTSGEKKMLKEQEKENVFSDVQLSAMSIDSIYSPKETLKWWAASAQEKTLNQELARRIRLISDTWVTDTVDKQAEPSTNMGGKCSSPLIKKSKHSSVVRSLFDCSPNKPRSCSMQQLSSWFMQTTETQPLSIVKKTSSRNPYELMHFPRSTNKKSFCYSPQAERLRKHLKKFAKSVPKSPYDFQQTQKIINEKKKILKHNLRLWDSPTTLVADRLYQNVNGKSKSFIKYQVTLFRAKRTFLTGKQRKSWMNNKTRPSLNGHVTVQPKQKALLKLTTKHLSCCGPTVEPVHAAKDHLCSKAWSSEKLKECRVFLRKIKSTDNKTSEEEENSCTVIMGDGSASELLFSKSEKQTEDVKAVKTEKSRRLNRVWLRDPQTLSPISTQKPHMMPMRGRRGRHRAGVVSESTQPPLAKKLRQSRMKGLSGPKWRDFVFGN